MDSREVVEVIAKEVDDERRREQQQRIAAAEKQVVGRPARSTDMHSMHRVRERLTAMPDCKCPTLCWAPGRPPGRPVEESGRPPGRPHEETVSAQLSVGHPGDRPGDQGKRSVDRPVDRQSGAG